MGHVVSAFVFFVVLLVQYGAAQTTRDTTEPKLLSVYPVAGQRGTTLQVEVRGNLIEGARSVWFDEPGLSGSVLHTELAKEQKEKTNPFEKQAKKALPVYRALIELAIQPTAPLGLQKLRLVSARGVSNPIHFLVSNTRLAMETASPHQVAAKAQPLKLPVIGSGKLSGPGELDYYSFHAREGEQLSFEVVPAEGSSDSRPEGFDPRVALYRPGGTWLNPDRPARVLFEQERSSDLMPVAARGTYRVIQEGEYLLEVSSLFGKGSGDSTYYFRIASRGQDLPKTMPAGFGERRFSRELNEGWLALLQNRSVEAGGAPAKGITVIQENEQNDRADQALEIPVPALIEGTIERPGDVDNFRFKAEPGQKLAFEVQTPQAAPPHFNPRLGIIDGQDKQMFSNMHRRISLYNNNSEPEVFLKAIEPKAIHTFERAGTYTLEVRDITSRYGGATYAYRILVRPQVPHLGEVSVTTSSENPPRDVDHINVIRGKAKKFIITSSYEEGFTGDVTFTFEGLPKGVHALPAARATDDKAPTEVTENPDTVAPKKQQTTIMLVADPDAEVSAAPMVVELHSRPIVKGEPGPSLLVNKVPLMVIEAPQL